jgi:DNA-binding PadR family transcriptional regulator
MSPHRPRTGDFRGRPPTFAMWMPPPPGYGPGPGPGWGRRGPGGRGRGRGRRGRRGDVRTAVRALLAERPMHGYEMIQELDARTGGLWKPSPGSVYPTLQMLEDEGLIASDKTEGRKRFSLTDAGQEAAAAAAANPPWADIADDTVAAAQDLRRASVGIMTALAEVNLAGTAGQQARALELLNATKRKLYAILAEDDPEEATPQDAPPQDAPPEDT